MVDKTLHRNLTFKYNESYYKKWGEQKDKQVSSPLVGLVLLLLRDKNII
jgi:hypothetical protein